MKDPTKAQLKPEAQRAPLTDLEQALMSMCYTDTVSNTLMHTTNYAQTDFVLRAILARAEGRP